MAVEDNVLVNVGALDAADTNANCSCTLQIRDKLIAQKNNEACVTQVIHVQKDTGNTLACFSKQASGHIPKNRTCA